MGREWNSGSIVASGDYWIHHHELGGEYISIWTVIKAGSGWQGVAYQIDISKPMQVSIKSVNLADWRGKIRWCAVESPPPPPW